MTTVVRERIVPHAHDLGGGFIVRRSLPTPRQQGVGPFVFMDHFGPVMLSPDRPMDVRPHPHIGLATVTYLWEGRIEHRDSLGNRQVIEAGAVNWMRAGRGIVHSERTAAADRGRGQPMHGLQLWVALPLEHERDEPSFEHTDAGDLPRLKVDDAELRIVAGTAYGTRSPVSAVGELFYVDARVPCGGRLRLPADHPQRAAYVVDGAMHAGDEPVRGGELTVFGPGAEVTLTSDTDTHVVLLGGAPLDAPRYMYWNYVASSPELLEQAKHDWAEGRFAMVEGDPEFIPLPGPGRVTLRLTP